MAEIRPALAQSAQWTPCMVSISARTGQNMSATQNVAAASEGSNCEAAATMNAPTATVRLSSP